MKLKAIILFIFLAVFFAEDFTFKDLPIQEDGRIKPIDSYARNQLLRFYGKSSYKFDDGSKRRTMWAVQTPGRAYAMFKLIRGMRPVVVQ